MHLSLIHWGHYHRNKKPSISAWNLSGRRQLYSYFAFWMVDFIRQTFSNHGQYAVSSKSSTSTLGVSLRISHNVQIVNIVTYLCEYHSSGCSYHRPLSSLEALSWSQIYFRDQSMLLYYHNPVRQQQAESRFCRERGFRQLHRIGVRPPKTSVVSSFEWSILFASNLEEILLQRHSDHPVWVRSHIPLSIQCSIG